MAPIDDGGGFISGALIGAGGLVGALLYVRRQLSRDATEIRGDRSERSQISRLEEEITRLTAIAAKASEDANNLRAQRTADAAKLASLEADARHLTRERDRLMRDIKRAVRTMPDDVRELLETDFSALGDVEERIDRR